jgi:RHS repeat-associated protein
MSNKRKRVELGSESSLADKDGDGYIEPFNINPDEKNLGGTSDASVDLTNTEVYQETHYYPFGMTMEGEWQNIVNGSENNYLYNGKELNSDFGARYYDAAIGRWGQVDPLAELRDWVSLYNYVQNNPLLRNDPTGALDNEYVVDSETGESVQVGTKGGDDVDYIYQGTITKNEEGGVESVAYTESNAKEVDVEHSFIYSGIEIFGDIKRGPGFSQMSTVATGATHSVDDPFTMMGPGLLKWGYKSIAFTTKEMSSLATHTAKNNLVEVSKAARLAIKGGTKNGRKLSVDEIGDFLGAGANWHKTAAKKKFLNKFKKRLKGDTNADFYLDKSTKEIWLKSNKSSNWVPTGKYF